MRLLKGVHGAPVSRRRVLISAAAACLPSLPGWAQGRSEPPVVGFLAAVESVQQVVARLGELGYAEGRNLNVITIAPVGVRGLPDAATRLIARRPDVLVAEGPAVMALAAFANGIPVVGQGVLDPVGSGIAQSLERPGGNVTGLVTEGPDAADAALGLLRQMRPGLRRIALLHSPGSYAPVQMREHAAKAKAAGLDWSAAPIGSIEDAERVLPALAGEAAWLASLGHPRLWRPVLDKAHQHRIATVGSYPGALMGYSQAFSDAPRRMASIIDRILKGAKPANIPFELPDRPVFVLNRSTARRIGIEVPPEVLLRATELVD